MSTRAKELLLTVVFSAALPLIARAQTGQNSPQVTGQNQPQVTGQNPGGLVNPLGFDTLQEFFAELLDVIVLISWPIVVLAVIWTGFLFVTAGGDRTKLETAKRAFLWTVVGGLVVLGAAAVAELIEGTVKELR